MCHACVRRITSTNSSVLQVLARCRATMDVLFFEALRPLETVACPTYPTWRPTPSEPDVHRGLPRPGRLCAVTGPKCVMKFMQGWVIMNERIKKERETERERESEHKNK